MITLEGFLKYLIKEEGSDIHICAGRRPHIRIHGDLIATKFNILKPDDVKELIYDILTKEQITHLEKNKELDIAHMMPELARFRINTYRQRGSLAFVVRAIPFQIKSFEELGIPAVVRSFIDNMHGLILVTGPQGSGKTTTLAAIIDYINTTRKSHVMTIEDPIEYLHRSKKSVINQREIGKDTDSYNTAMRYIMRQDPDVCLIGEIRDNDSVQTALSLAEAGILVLSTLHSPSAAKTVNRIVDMFEPESQHRVRNQLSLTLKAVVSQQLIPRRDRNGRVLACEIMKVTDSIENMIRSYSVKQIYSIIQTGRAHGMHTMDQYLFQLYTKGIISKYELSKRVAEPAQAEKWLEELETAKKP